MENEERCPHCGGTEFVEGVQDGYAAISPAHRILSLKSQALYHVICADCGMVIRSYVRKPEKLR